MSTKCTALAVLVGAHALIFENSADIQVFTANKCAEIVDKANTSGHVTEESSVSVCRKHLQSKETCGLLGEMLALAQMRDDFNRSSFCETMSFAHACSAAMEDFLSSDAVADLAFGHCLRSHRLRQAKTDATVGNYCQCFQGVLSAAVKASDTIDTLRECYMMELEQRSHKSSTAQGVASKVAQVTQMPQQVPVPQSQEGAKTQAVQQIPAAQPQEGVKTQAVQQIPAAQPQEGAKTQAVQQIPAAQPQVQQIPAAQPQVDSQVQQQVPFARLQAVKSKSAALANQTLGPGLEGNLSAQVLGNLTKGKKEYTGFLSKFANTTSASCLFFVSFFRKRRPRVRPSTEAIAMAKEDSSGSSSESEEDKESLDDKLKRITKLGKEGNVEGLVKEAKLADCSPEMVSFASRKAKDLSDVPEKYKIYSNRSACQFQLGRYTEALVEATKAIKENRSWSKGYFRAGRAALEMEYYQEALEMFEKGLEKEPSNKDLVTWTQKARDIRNQQQQDKLVKKHTTDYSKFDSLMQQQKEEEDEEEELQLAANDPNRIILGDKYYSSSKMEQRQLKAMLGYKEPPPPPFEPKFDMDVIYRHDNRGAKTQHPIWDPTTREWRIDAKPAPSRVDYSDSQQAQAIALFLERQSEVQHADELLNLVDQRASPVEAYVQAVRDVVGELMGATDKDGKRRKHSVLGNDARWLFVGLGSALPLLTAARYLPASEIVANTAHRGAYIADLYMTIARENGLKSQQVKFVHRPSHELAVVDPDGADENNLTGRVDVAVLDYELFDPGLIGKGVLAKVNHVKKKLVTSDHMILPMGAQILCAPCEIVCPRGDGPDGLDWQAGDDSRWGAFYEAGNFDGALRECGTQLTGFQRDVWAAPTQPLASKEGIGSNAGR
eukprot:s2521_g2.t1